MESGEESLAVCHETLSLDLNYSATPSMTKKTQETLPNL